ncbi:MAG: serine hydrolase domain-containing protein [Anaerolineales bacterium]
MRVINRSVQTALLVLLAVTVFILPLPLPAAAEPVAQGPRDPAELEAFVDGLIGGQLGANNVAGATVAVVANGEILLAKGYGYADVAGRAPVDPATTLFRIGSVTKLFTWTAVMQLVEEGKIDLNEDVNAYLDFEIPGAYGIPITMLHLLTHTPGFEDRGFGMWAADPESLVPNGEWLKEHIPARVRPPGTYTAYSNYGVALAGYIVERVSGLSYAAYVRDHILKPLEMDYTTAAQPLPERLAPHMSQGYRYLEGSYQPEGFELLSISPAGSISASARDMAHFMLAYLNEGSYGDTRILEERTARRMVEQQLFTHDERLNGWTYGFMELDSNGQRVVGHGGDTLLFHSLLALLPEKEVGVFVSYNSLAGQLLPQTFLAAFLDHYYPERVSALSAPTDFSERAAHFTGSYRMNRASHTQAEKALGLIQYVTVSATADGRLLVSSPLGPQSFIEVEPLLFREERGHDLLLFEAAEGTAARAYLDSIPFMALEKLEWYEAPPFHYLLIGGSLLLFLSYLIALPIYGYVGNRIDPDRAPPTLAIVARWQMVALVLLSFFLVAGFAVVINDVLALMTGETELLTTLGGVSVAIAVLALDALVMTFLVWIKGYWRFPARVHYTLVTLGALAFVWVLYYWNLLGWKF